MMVVDTEHRIYPFLDALDSPDPKRDWHLFIHHNSSISMVFPNIYSFGPNNIDALIIALQTAKALLAEVQP